MPSQCDHDFFARSSDMGKLAFFLAGGVYILTARIIVAIAAFKESVGKGFLVFGTSARKTGRLVVDGENVSWFDAEDPKKNFSLYARNIREVFNTCLLRPGQNLCLEFGFVTHTGEEYRFRDAGWKARGASSSLTWPTLRSAPKKISCAPWG